jgi:DNA-binding GntR family transcriptional regulator
MAIELQNVQKIATRVPASATIANAVRRAILSGELAENTRLGQDEIAALFGVSKIPVREALKQLEAEGLVAFTQQRGATVVSLSEDEIIELFEIRAALEELAARLSVANLTASSLSAAEAALVAYDNETDVARWGALNWAFHSALYKEARKPTLLGYIKSVHDKLDRYLRAQLTLTKGIAKSQAEHYQILEHARQGRVDEVAALTRRHVMEAGDSLIRFLRASRQQISTIEN